jgi:glycosyltransferase involved in cell wall biosynthesis
MAIVGLVMIVKDEEAVIERALRSALPFISTYVIVDTGSTDRTKEIIRTVLAGIPGILEDRSWVSFGFNRTEALSLCDGRMDWALMLDADDSIEGEPPAPEQWMVNGVDGFIMRIQHGAVLHQRVQVFRTERGWIYEGVVHEAARLGDFRRPALAMMPGDSIVIARCEGARSRDPNKYMKDVALLEAELMHRPGDARVLFYLAQSYRDAGLRDKAQEVYRRYLECEGTWVHEQYMVLVNLIELVEDADDKIRLAWRAINVCPDRLEAQFALLRWWRRSGTVLTQQVYAIASVVTNRVPPSNALYVSPAVYEWVLDAELAEIAVALGHYRVAYEAASRTAASNAPVSMIAAALKTAKAALSHIREHH